MLVLGTNIAVLLDCSKSSRQCSLPSFPLVTDQVIREDPAVRSSCVRGRGTETSAEVLVGPPWRMESNAPVNSSGTRLTFTLDGGPMGHSAR